MTYAKTADAAAVTYTHNATNWYWLDLHRAGKCHKMVTWQERFEPGTDGKLRLYTYVYRNEDLTTPVAKINIDGRSRERLGLVFDALSERFEPADENL